ALPIWIDFMKVALADAPVVAYEPPAGMVRVSVSADGRLLAGDSGGIVEYLKAEDLERMESASEFDFDRSEEHTSELQSRENLVCRLLLEKKKRTRV